MIYDMFIEINTLVFQRTLIARPGWYIKKVVLFLNLWPTTMALELPTTNGAWQYGRVQHAKKSKKIQKIQTNWFWLCKIRIYIFKFRSEDEDRAEIDSIHNFHHYIFKAISIYRKSLSTYCTGCKTTFPSWIWGYLLQRTKKRFTNQKVH